MPFWEFTPQAGPHDGRWRDHKPYARVVVEADTAAQARLIAGRELYKTETAPQFGHERDVIFNSAFRDAQLYQVREVGAAGVPAGEGVVKVADR